MSQSILFLMPQLPYPAHQGTTLRNFGLLNGLAGRGHKVSLLTFEDDRPPDDESYGLLKELCEHFALAQFPTRSTINRIVDLAQGHTDMARRLWSDGFRARLELLTELNQFDIIHIEGIEMAPYIPYIKGDAKVIYDAHNAEYALQQRIAERASSPVRRLYSGIQAARLKQWEAEVCTVCDHVIAVSERDADHLRALNAETPITVLSNAIDTNDYSIATVPADISRPALVFTGKMDFRPNVDAALWFADAILPLIHQQQPGVEFVIVGKHPHPNLAVLRSKEHIVLTGFVPEIEPYMAAADVYIAPLRMGSGTRFKLLQAMAMKRPIVSTTIGAEGLDVIDKIHLFLADTPESFAEAVLNVLSQPKESQTMTQDAYQLVTQRYDWAAILPILEAVYEKLA